MLYSIVIPAFNEESRVGGTVLDLMRVFGGEAEVIVVDDGSRDRTGAVARGLGAVVLRHDVNRGKGAAIKTGLGSSRGGVVGFVDADGSTDAESVKRVFDSVDGCDIAVGSRHTIDSFVPVKQSIIRVISSRIFNLLVRLILNLNLRDTQCGCKAFKKEVIDRVMDKSRFDGYVFDAEILYRGMKAGASIKEVGIVWRAKGGSKFSILGDSLKMFRDIVWLRLRG
jgi:glycosyltransferase involved in cell wall biosynthesis